MKELLSEIDSQEIAEWYAYDQRWPLPDSWQETARLCRIVMCSSGNYMRNQIPKEADFIPASKKPSQTQDDMWSELMKLRE